MRVKQCIEAPAGGFSSPFCLPKHLMEPLNRIPRGIHGEILSLSLSISSLGDVICAAWCDTTSRIISKH